MTIEVDFRTVSMRQFRQALEADPAIGAALACPYSTGGKCDSPTLIPSRPEPFEAEAESLDVEVRRLPLGARVLVVTSSILAALVPAALVAVATTWVVFR